MYEDERDTWIHENVDYATKNYELVLEKEGFGEEEPGAA
jgi:hypothetical protein